MSKNFDETVRLQTEKRQEWIREIRGERLQGIAEGASSAPRPASLSAVSFPGRNECLGTHYSLIRKQEERKESSCQICQREIEVKAKTEERIRWRGQSECQIGGKVRQSHRCQKEKEQSRLSRVPDHEVGKGQGGREPYLDEKERDQNQSMEWKGWTP